MTTVCVFVPIVFVEGIAGQLFGDQALTVTFSLAVSLLVALTLIPMLASREFRAAPAGERPAFRTAAGRLVGKAIAGIGSGIRWVAFGAARGVELALKGILFLPSLLFQLGYSGVVRAYPKTLDAALRHPFRVTALAVALFAGAAALLPGLGSELVPELIQGEFFVDTELPAGTHLELNARRMERLEGGRRRDFRGCARCTPRSEPAASREAPPANCGRTSASSPSSSTRRWTGNARSGRWRSCVRSSRPIPTCSTCSAAPPTSVSGTPVELEIRGFNLPCWSGSPTRRWRGSGRSPASWM